MGTIAVVTVYSEQNLPILHLYVQCDGYPSGIGDDLREKLGHLRLVNGIRPEYQDVANGMGCFAAQLVAALKTGPGAFYL